MFDHIVDVKTKSLKLPGPMKKNLAKTSTGGNEKLE